MTDPGRTRVSNEDSITIATGDRGGGRGTLLILADGLGGHNAGEVASRMAITELPRHYFGRSGDNHFDDLLAGIGELNTAVHTASLQEGAHNGMCTTLVVALVVNQYAVFVSVGDSRGYLIRNGAVIHRTKDHSLREGRLGGTFLQGRMSHVLTQAIGPHPRVLPDISIRKVAAGDRILLCSDGLTDVVTDEEILAIATGEPVTDAAPRLIDLAKRNGSNDNISVVLGHVARVSSSSSFQIHMNDLDRYLVGETAPEPASKVTTLIA
jgi:protein phosphatase